MPPEGHNPAARPEQLPLAGEAGALHGHQAASEQEVGRVGVQVLCDTGPLPLLTGQQAASPGVHGGLPGLVGHTAPRQVLVDLLVRPEEVS